MFPRNIGITHHVLGHCRENLRAQERNSWPVFWENSVCSAANRLEEAGDREQKRGRREGEDVFMNEVPIRTRARPGLGKESSHPHTSPTEIIQILWEERLNLAVCALPRILQRTLPLARKSIPTSLTEDSTP